MHDFWKDSRWSEEQEQAAQDRSAVRILTCPKRICRRMQTCEGKDQSAKCPALASENPGPAGEGRDRMAALRAILKRVVDIYEADGEEAWRAALKVWSAAEEKRDKLAWERAKAAVKGKGR